MGCDKDSIPKIVVGVLSGCLLVASIVGCAVVFKQYVDSPWKVLDSDSPAFIFLIVVMVMAIVSAIFGLTISCCCRCAYCLYIFILVVCIIVEIVCLALSFSLKKKTLENAGKNWYGDAFQEEARHIFEKENKCCGYNHTIFDQAACAASDAADLIGDLIGDGDKAEATVGKDSCEPIMKDKINKSYSNLQVVSVVVLIVEAAVMIASIIYICSYSSKAKVEGSELED
ncbi:hypothetical protein M9Y10_026439 [Tritrichomonas musculus]|uniref:Tetraspanin family protein n=1 Tax=Tritrichomonas musculus TaxID=1915356 RepID=A0ABR2H8N6_9EUKA